jgi:MoaA/NifB/PqqE/SkfB family radical SAM enzyme
MLQSNPILPTKAKKVYRISWPRSVVKLVKARFFNKKFPHSVSFNITYHCNLRCDYCASYEDRTPEMSTDQIFQMIDELVEMGTTRFSITGGEPMLRKDLGEVVSHARSRGLFVSVATNGSFLPHRLDYLRDVNSVNMTLDGPEEIHDSQRGKGDFKKVIRAAELLRENGIFYYLNVVLTKNNCSMLPELLAIARSLKVRMMLQPVFYSKPSHASDLKGYKKTKYEDKEFFDTLDQLIEEKKKGNPYILLSKNYYEEVKENIQRKTKIVCKNGGGLFLTVSPEGNVTPCNLLVKGSRWNNGLEMGFRRAYFNMPPVNCAGCISSLIDFDDVYNLKLDPVWNFLKLNINQLSP